MMNLHPIDVANLGPGRIIDLDLDHHGRPLALMEGDYGRMRVMLSSGRSINMSIAPQSRLSTIRSVGDSTVVVAPIATATDDPVETCALVTLDSFAVLPFGAPADLFVGGPFVFTSYTERVLLFTREPSFEDDIVTVFDSQTHARLFGVADLLSNRRDEPDCYEVTSACTTATNELVFVGLGAPHLWTLDPHRRRVTTVRPNPPLPDADQIQALATTESGTLVLSTGADALNLMALDRSGTLISRSSLSASTVHGALGSYASEMPGGGWRLDAAVRGLHGGRFLIRTTDRALLLTLD